MYHRLLIISPNFPPINSPEYQRIRMSLPYFAEFGWDVTVLCIDPSLIEGIYDINLIKTVPENIEVIQSYAIPPKISRKFGVGSLAFRSIPFLIKETYKYFERNHFDLVYFSNTAFLTMPLGRYWLAKYKVPYILDFQDPWLSDYYDRTNNAPPGGKIKYKFGQALAQILEPFTLKKASHIISVSAEYPRMLMHRYLNLQKENFTVLPFGAPEKDFAILPSLNIEQKFFNPHDGKKHWIYVGRCGDDMILSLRILFAGIQCDRQQSPEAWKLIELHFVGTSYAPGNKSVKTVEPIAQEFGIGDLVKEYSHRIPYFEALQIMVDSDAILLIGSDDPGYTASKLYPCILARKPILAVFHEQSSVIDILTSCGAGRAVTFNRGDQLCDLTPKALAGIQWLQSLPADYQPDTNWQAFQPYTAKEMTRKQCEIFDRVVGTVSQN
jgi:hypothetical protein